eukprot:scaffold15992_cov118-Isochrysis_galbana.AAC.4
MSVYADAMCNVRNLLCLPAQHRNIATRALGKKSELSGSLSLLPALPTCPAHHAPRAGGAPALPAKSLAPMLHHLKVYRR